PSWPAKRFGSGTALLALAALALSSAAAAPASAGEALGRGQSFSFKVGQVPPPRVGRQPSRTSGAGREVREPKRWGKRVGKARRPYLPPLVTIPAQPPVDGDGLGNVPHRSDRGAPSLAQSPSVPRQVLIVLDQNQSG